MTAVDFAGLTRYAKQFSGLTPEHEEMLVDIKADINSLLDEVTDRFYATLSKIDKTAPFLEGRLESLKRTHRAWLERLFSGPYYPCS